MSPSQKVKPGILRDQDSTRRVRDIITPEGVRLSVELAERGERAAAILLDLLMMVGLFIGGLLTLVILLGILPDGWGLVVFLISFFLVRNFYFTFFELRWHGQTPGKKMVGLRVIDRHGGRLRPDAVFARNLTREVELFIPITLILSGNLMDLHGLAQLLSLVWVGIFLLMPFFNKDSLRIGDMVAGTWVVVTPKAALMADLVGRTYGHDTPKEVATGTPSPSVRPAAKDATYAFSDQQLDIYGIYELQALEDVLRRKDAKARDVRREVCERICKKLDYNANREESLRIDVDVFLEEFYAALRKRLETRMLLGKRRESQHDV